MITDNDHANKRPRYIHALRFSWLNRFYDPIVRWTTKEAKFKRRLVEQAAVGHGRALDLGCGTATLTIMLKREFPDAEVSGLDGDPGVLKIARQKAEQEGANITLQQGMVDDPPFADNSFDRVVSSLLFHHLDRPTKQRTLAKALALLKPGGELHIADWGRAGNPGMRIAFLAVQLLDGFETTGDNVRGLLVEMIKGAGFEDVAETHRESTILGNLSLYRARKPA
jgi:ubiquinone/menaquinone biosynthesis C-methylase UbiE